MQFARNNRYAISLNASIPEDANIIIIAMHGFCGDKASSCIEALEKSAFRKNIGLIKFDWPGHGESEVTGEQLTIENCLTDIDSVVEYARGMSSQAKLVAFATSFGGYLTLLYLCEHIDVFDKVILRSPAIKMYDVLTGTLLTKGDLAEIEKRGSVEFGFERKLAVTSSFLSELKKNDVSSLLRGKNLHMVSIIHGTADDMVPFSDSVAFAAEHECQLYPVEGADHRYKKDGEIEQVIDAAMRIILGPSDM